MDVSSDSEDDCYGNAAKRLENLKKKYQDDNIQSTNLLNDSLEMQSKTNNVNKNSIKTTLDSTECIYGPSNEELFDDIELEKLLAINTQRRITRSSKRKSNIDLSILQTSSSINNSRSTKRGRRGDRNSSKNGAKSNEIEVIPATRGKPRRNRPRQVNDNNIPTISIGNTMDYPDQSKAQTLFSNNVNNDIVIIDDNDLLDENEELFLKVYWQSSEIFKFSVRKYQNLKTIFRHFSEKENVNQNQLLFTYNDTILKPDDTPDSINYNIAKFIDGGIINGHITWVNGNQKNECVGIKIKFQFQNVKKPFETSIQVHDKLALAMMKCAEHIEIPLTKLRFEFDGENILGFMTPKDLDMEGGESIDVKIFN